MVRCRTCGVVRAPVGGGAAKAIGRFIGRILLLSAGVAAADVFVALLLGRGNVLAAYPTAVLISGISILILGGVKGGAPRAAGVYTSGAEIRARFGWTSGAMDAMLMLGGLFLIAMWLLMHLVIG